MAADQTDDEVIRKQVYYRAEIQNVLFRLYVSLPTEKLASDKKEGAIYGQLVGAAFSLWRAIFLIHDVPSGLDITQQESLNHWNKVKDFIKVVVRENTVTWATDKTYRTWMAGYYTNSAVYRLKRVANDPRFKDLGATTTFVNRHKDDTDDLVNFNIWNVWAESFLALKEIVGVLHPIDFTIPPELSPRGVQKS